MNVVTPAINKVRLSLLWAVFAQRVLPSNNARSALVEADFEAELFGRRVGV